MHRFSNHIPIHRGFPVLSIPSITARLHSKMETGQVTSQTTSSTSILSKSTEQNRLPLASWKVGLLITLIATIIALLFTFVVYPKQGTIEARIDLNGFGFLARNIAKGEGFSLGHGPTLRRAPLYPALLALVLKTFGNYDSTIPDAIAYRPMQILQCLFFGLTCLVCWRVTLLLFGALPALASATLCAITPQTLRYVPMTEVECLLGLLIVLIALTAALLYRQPNLRNGVFFASVCAAAALTKPVVLFFPFLFCALLLIRRLWARNKGDASPLPFPTILTVLILFVSCLLPWSLRNGMLTNGKFWGISSNAPGEFLRGYVNAQPKFAFLQQDFGGHDPSRIQWDWEANLYEHALLQKHGLSFFSTERFGPNGEYYPMEARVELELAKEKVEGAEMRRRIVQEPVEFIKKFAVQTLTFWYIVETRKKSVIIGSIALLMLSLATVGWINAQSKRIDALPVLSVILYFNLIYAAILAFARYSMPVYPTLLVLSGYGLTVLLSKFHQRVLVKPRSPKAMTDGV